MGGSKTPQQVSKRVFERKDLAMSGWSESNTIRDLIPKIDSSFEPGRPHDPMSELMRSIILRAIDDLRSGGELHVEALKYFNDENGDYVFSFVSICDHFGLDPKLTRKIVLRDSSRISTRRRAA